MTQIVGEEEEEAERRARNLQRKQQQKETEVTDSPGMDRQGSSQSRRSLGGISGLTHAQLAEHYQHCLKLSAENKVSTKNAFNLQLIDWMAQAIGKKQKSFGAGGVDMNDFQVAAGTLDASTKIYSFRVDVVYNDTFKLASGLSQTGKQQKEDGQHDNLESEEGGEAVEGFDPENPDQVKKRKRIKKSATVEKNLKNINVSKMELEFDTDPLFKKTTSQFDVAGGGGNQFLATLRIKDDTAELMMDSESVLENRSCITPRKSAGTARVPPLLSIVSPLHACPEELRDFSFLKWTLDEEDRLSESITASQEERNEERAMNDDHAAFDAFAVPEPVDDQMEAGMVDNDMDDDYDEVRGEVSERALGHKGFHTSHGFTANLQMSPADMLSILTTAPLEYSYFDHGKLGAWAGPKHWKFKALSRPKDDEGGGNKGGRKKKQTEHIDYDFFEDFVESELGHITDLLKFPKKSVKLIDKTMKGWNRERSTLPEDLHYSGHELVRLKHVEKIVVTASSGAVETEVQVDEDVEDYDYDNALDHDEYCPDIDGQEDAYGDAGVVMNGDDCLAERLSGEGMEGQADDYGADNLVEAPKTVDRAALQIGYAKTAKKVDMRRIKEATWRILTQDKENQNTESPDKQNDDSNDSLQETAFSTLYKTLKQPNKLPKTMSDNLSVPLAFIALLHLCNERTLHLTAISDDFKDFSISKG